MNHLRIQAYAPMICLLLALQTHGSEKEPEQLQTGILGGVKNVTAADLKSMYEGQYILHARRGKLTKVSVQKCRLPHDPKANPQTVQAVLAPDGTVYVTLASIICKSTDGGRTWTSHARGPGMDGYFDVLSNGTFIRVAGSGKTSDPTAVMASTDDGVALGDGTVV